MASRKPNPSPDNPVPVPEPRILDGHTDTVYSVAVTPDGQRIVSGSDDETIRVWDAVPEMRVDAPPPVTDTAP